MPSSVFVSHPSKDKATADAICQRLEEDGIKYWIAPRDIAYGSNSSKASRYEKLLAELSPRD